MKKIIIVFLIFSMGLLLFSCAKIETEINQSAKSDENNELNDEKETEKQVTEEDRIDRLESMCVPLSVGLELSDNVKDREITIQTIKKVSELRYIIYGRITVEDVYGTFFNNTFDCVIEFLYEDSLVWQCESVEFHNWSKK